MDWTKEIPTKADLPGRKGYYWYRSDKRSPQPVSIYLEGDTGWITFIGDRHSHFLEETVRAENGELLGPMIRPERVEKD
jgi:hypothetical protein